MSGLKQQQKPEISNIYQKGDFIDAQDSQGDWRVGYIVEKNVMMKIYKVRFDGWSFKYDEDYNFNSHKLRQFRSIVVGYTGQQSYPALRNGWKFNLRELQDKLLDLNEYIQNGCSRHTQNAHKFNQYFRGYNYLYCDFLMTTTFSSNIEIHKVLQFFKYNIKLAELYLVYILNNFDKFIKNLQKVNNQHLDDIGVAKSKAFYEIFDMVYIILGCYNRNSSFFKDNWDLLKQEYQHLQELSIIEAHQFQMTEFFRKLKGFSLLEELLKKISSLNKPLPNLFLYSLAHLAVAFKNQQKTLIRQHLIGNFQQVANNTLNFIGDKQMKEFTQNQFIDFIHEIFTFSQYTAIEKSTQKWMQSTKLAVYFKMISCQYFEKKQKGIASLQQLIQQNVEEKKKQGEHDLIENGTLYKWIEQIKLFDVLFITDKPQLMKKSTELIKYLYQRDNEMEKYIKLLWRYREGKHEAILKEIYSFMGEIPKYGNNQQFTRNLFREYLSNLDEPLWDSQYLKMLKDYTVNALNNFKEENIEEIYGYNIFYNYLLKNQSDATIIGYLIQILIKLKQTKVLQILITEYFISIEKNLHPKLHVTLLIKILKEKIIDVRSIQIECQQIIQKRIISMKNSLQNLQQQFQLLNEFLKQSKQVIPTRTFFYFWDEMINSKSRVHFLKFLFKVRDSGKVVLTSFINSQTKGFMLQNFWTEEYLQNNKIDGLQATFLLEIFKSVNDRSEKIKRTNLVFEVLDDRLIGIEKIHSAYLTSKDPKADQILAKGLSQIYYSSSKSLAEQGIDLLGDFVKKIFILLKNFSEIKNLQGLNKMLRSLEQLILRDQEIFNVQQIVRMEDFKNIIVKNLETKEEKIIRINLLLNIYSIKKIIAEKFNLELNKFDIVLNDDEKVGYESYFKIFGDVDTKAKIQIIYRAEDFSKTKLYLSQHLEDLFELLGNKAIEERVWSIISKFSISEEIRQKLLQAQNPLQILANNNSFYKELYIFKAAFSIECKWWNEPLEQLTTFFINRLKTANAKTEISRQYIMVCGKLLENVIKKEETINQKIIIETFSNLIQISKKVLIQSHKTENLNISYVKKFLQSFFNIGEQLHVYLVRNEMIKNSPDAMTLILNSPSIEDFFKLCIIEHRHEDIRKFFSVKLAAISKHNKEKYAAKLTRMIFEDLLDATVTSETKTLSPFIIYSCFILENMDGFLKEFYAQKKSTYFDKLWGLIQNQAPQKNAETVNNRLQCYFSLIKFTIREVPFEDLQKFVMYLWSDCLFHDSIPKCKSKETRNSVFNIFVKFVKYNKAPQVIFSIFSHLHQTGFWRTRKLDDWTIIQAQRVKSTTNYVGLKNLGCICYMNSFFQQIFMIQEFRKAILFAEIPEQNQKRIEDNVMYQIKKMFINLIYSEKKAYNPISFCQSFKDYDDNPIDVNQQMDIDQFSANLFDKIEDLLRETSYKGFIKENFEGVYSNEIICKGCSKVSESEESFLSLGLTVKSKRSIHESLETMIKGDNLDGENAYFCERCRKKVSAVKRVCLKKLPNNLIISLKRFQFNFTSNTKNKLNDYCQFPQDLDLKDYSYHHLRKTENLVGQKEQQMKDDKYYQYELKGVVIHTGSADSGHYYSLIQERSGQKRWIEFNDSTVRKFNIENLSDEAFGGYTGSGPQRKQKIKNAYLLVYERVQKINSIDSHIENLSGSFRDMEMYKEVLKSIDIQNHEHIIENVLFSSEYTKFIQSLIDEVARNKSNLELQKFIISAVLTVIIRQKTNGDNIDTLKNVYNVCCKGNKTLCEFIISEFCDLRIYEEFFRSCPLKEIRRNVATWLGMVLSEVSDEIREKFIKLVMLKITKDKENNFEGLTILHNLSWDQKCLGVMLKHNLIGRLFENILKIEQRIFLSTEMLESSIDKEETYLGCEQIIEKTSFELKKIKYDNQSGYVWATINKIITRFSLHNLFTILCPKQVQYLYLADRVQKILPQLKTKFDIDAYTDLLAYLSHENLQFSKILFGFIEKDVKALSSKKYRQYFILFQKLINIQDHLVEERITGIFNLIRSLKANEKYNLDCTIIELWICKVINQSQPLRNYLIRERTILQYLASLPLKKVPSEEYANRNAKFIDALINKFHGIPFPVTSQGYTYVLTKVQRFYQKLLRNENEQVNWFQSGNHLAYDRIAAGDKIAYFDAKDKLVFEEAVIKEVFSDKIFIFRKSFSNKSFWIWKDDERLTSNIRVIKRENTDELNSSITSDMEEDEIDQITAI